MSAHDSSNNLDYDFVTTGGSGAISNTGNYSYGSLSAGAIYNGTAASSSSIGSGIFQKQVVKMTAEQAKEAALDKLLLTIKNKVINFGAAYFKNFGDDLSAEEALGHVLKDMVKADDMWTKIQNFKLK